MFTRSRLGSGIKSVSNLRLSKVASPAVNSLNNSSFNNSLTYQPNRTFFTAKEGVMCFFGTVFFVREKYAWLIHRFQKFNRQVKPGLNFKIPFIETLEYTHDLREQVFEISSQVAVTRDNVALHIDGVLYLKVEDPYKASYGVENLNNAITNLAQTTMRSEIGKLALDKTFEERDKLNERIVSSIDKETKDWGAKCIRYEIKDIEPPKNIQESMILQAEAERKKRANMIQSEGERQSRINIAEANKNSKILRAEGAAEAIIKKAEASGEALKNIAESLSTKDSARNKHIINYILGERYIDAYRKIGKENNTMFIQSQPQMPIENVSSSFNLMDDLNKKIKTK